jgi:hypothetical protein
MTAAHYNQTVTRLAPGQMSNPATTQNRHDNLLIISKIGHTRAMLTLDTWMSAACKRCGLS